MLFKKTYQKLTVMGVGIVSSFALMSTPALADALCAVSQSSGQPIVTKQLNAFEQTADATRAGIDFYVSAARGRGLHQQSHSVDLIQVKENVNLLGRQLNELEALDEHGTEVQKAAIREARPHLDRLATHVQTAIVLLNDRTDTRSREFQQTIKGMYNEADRLYSKVDAMTDYQKACGRAAELTAAGKLTS